MKAASAGFKTMLSTSQNLMQCDLYTITLASGTVLRYATAPQAIVFGSTFLQGKSGTTPGFKRGALKLAIGMQVESIDVTVLFDATTLILGKTPAAFANAGGFDNARIVIDKLLTPDFNDTSRGIVNLFTGIVSAVDAMATTVALHCASDLVFLNAQFPRNYYLPACNHALFDAGCGLVKSTYAVAGTCTAGNTTNALYASGLTQATSYFALGYVIINTGANAGLVRSVKASVSGVLTLLYPLPVACATSDTFTAYPGCDKLQATCSAKFNNIGKFRGFPYVPPPETVVSGQNGQSPGGAGGGGGGGNNSFGAGTGGQNTGFNQF